jgi:broad specificity phosphatase PhoE
MLPKAKKTVFLVRHGQSVDNAAPVFQSDDSPLSEKGKGQANQIANRVSNISFGALISSPFPRAVQTAEAIASKTGKKIEFSDLFTERIKPSSMDGKRWDDPLANKTWRKWEESLYDPSLRVEDGENYSDIISLADNALADLLGRPEQTMVVVSHGHFIRTIVSRILLGDLLTGNILQKIQKVASIENTGITVIQYSDAFEEEECWRLWTYNDHSHFADD